MKFIIIYRNRITKDEYVAESEDKTEEKAIEKLLEKVGDGYIYVRTLK